MQKQSVQSLEFIVHYWKLNNLYLSPYSEYVPSSISRLTRTTDTQWKHKSKISEKLGRCGRQNRLQPYLTIWDWDWIFGRAVKSIFSLGVRSPCLLSWTWWNWKHFRSSIFIFTRLFSNLMLFNNLMLWKMKNLVLMYVKKSTYYTKIGLFLECSLQPQFVLSNKALGMRDCILELKQFEHIY